MQIFWAPRLPSKPSSLLRTSQYDDTRHRTMEHQCSIVSVHYDSLARPLAVEVDVAAALHCAVRLSEAAGHVTVPQ